METSEEKKKREEKAKALAGAGIGVAAAAAAVATAMSQSESDGSADEAFAPKPHNEDLVSEAQTAEAETVKEMPEVEVTATAPEVHRTMPEVVVEAPHIEEHLVEAQPVQAEEVLVEDLLVEEVTSVEEADIPLLAYEEEVISYDDNTDTNTDAYTGNDVIAMEDDFGGDLIDENDNTLMANTDDHLLASRNMEDMDDRLIDDDLPLLSDMPDNIENDIHDLSDL